MAFDADQYKATTRRQREDYAGGWNDWAPLLETWLGEATERMLDLAGVETTSHVLDAAISRVGLIYFPNRQQALTGIHHALREGGRFATVTYSTAATNGFSLLPVSIIRERVHLPAPAPDQPGPFSLAGPEVLGQDLGEDGFHDFTIEVIETALGQYDTEDGFFGPCELVFAGATR